MNKTESVSCRQLERRGEERRGEKQQERNDLCVAVPFIHVMETIMVLPTVFSFQVKF
jgi:hypothetical protein